MRLCFSCIRQWQKCPWPKGNAHVEMLWFWPSFSPDGKISRGRLGTDKRGKTADWLTEGQDLFQLPKASSLLFFWNSYSKRVVFLVCFHVATVFFRDALDKAQKQEMGAALFLWSGWGGFFRRTHNGLPFSLINSFSFPSEHVEEA